MIKDYSTIANASWKPTKAGSYDVWTDVKDATGKVVSQKKKYVINNLATINSFKADVVSPQPLGTNVKLSATGTGEGTYSKYFKW